MPMLPSMELMLLSWLRCLVRLRLRLLLVILRTSPGLLISIALINIMLELVILLVLDIRELGTLLIRIIVLRILLLAVVCLILF